MTVKKWILLFTAVLVVSLGFSSDLAVSQDGVLTQGKHAMGLVKALRIDYLLPNNAVEQDAADLLALLGIYPCNKQWEIETELSDEDYCCILGEEPGCEVFLSEDELRTKIFDAYPELFWVGTEPRQPVSPFVP